MKRATGPGRRDGESAFKTAWRAVTDGLAGGRPVESFPYSAPREGVLAPEMVRSGCNICFNSCSTRVYRRDGRAVTITGNPDDPVTGGHLCPKSQFLMQTYYSEHRLLYPQRRVGTRGEGKFERVSWDEALGVVGPGEGEDAGAELARTQVVLELAGRLARPAADATGQVDHQRELGHEVRDLPRHSTVG